MGDLRVKDHLEDAGLDERIILIKKNLRSVRRRGTDWNNLTQDRYIWRVHVNAVPYRAGNFLTR
jgi:hypothetical protein